MVRFNMHLRSSPCTQPRTGRTYVLTRISLNVFCATLFPTGVCSQQCFAKARMQLFGDFGRLSVYLEGRYTASKMGTSC